MATRNAGGRARRAPGGGARGSKRALLVAINDYGSPQNNLPSCLEDAAQFRSVLQSRYGFDKFTELYDGDATVANVDGGLAWLFENVADDDRLVFFYSGHGYQQSRNGNLDECLVLGNLEFFFDDRLSELSQSAPPGVLTVVLDSCFSGGMQKRIPLGEGVELARTKLWVPPPDASPNKSLSGGPLVPRPFCCLPVTGASAVKRLVLGTQTGPRVKAAGRQGVGGDETRQLQLNGLLLSACSENETASAATSATEGISAFTYALMDALPASGEIAVTQLHDGTRQRLAEMGFRQTPLLKVPASAAELASSSFVTLAPAAAAAGQSAKTLPAEADGEASTTVEATEDATMTDQQAYDQQFWRTVERVAAQVAFAAGNQASGEGKSFAPPSGPAAPPPGNWQEGGTAGPTPLPAGPTTRPANPAAGTPQAVAPSQPGRPSTGNGQAAGPSPRPAVPAPSQPSGDGSTAGGEKWIGPALRIAMAAGTAIDLALHARRKDFAAGIAAEPEGAERLAESVSEVVTPAIVDAIASRPEDFTLDLPQGAPSEDDGAGDDKRFPWPAVARVVASAVPAVVAEATGRNDPLPDLAADPTADDQKGIGSLIRIGRRLARHPLAAAVASGAAWHAIGAARGKGLGSGSAAELDDGSGSDDRIARAATRIAAEVVPAVVDELTSQSELGGQKMILPPGMQPPRVLPMPARYLIM